MVFEICVVDYLMNESGGVFHTGRIRRGVGAVKGEMELEVGEFLLKLQEVVEIEYLVERARAVEVVHLAVGGLQGLCHVHDLGAERGPAPPPIHIISFFESKMGWKSP